MDRREAIKKTFLLTGYALTASSIHAVLSGCEPERRMNWSPTYFSAEQADLVTHLAETILPRTKTPGAIDTGVPAFIEIMVKDSLLPEDQQLFAEGLADVDARAQAAHGKLFAQCKAAQQTKLVQKLDEEAAAEGLAYKERNKDLVEKEPFFQFFLNFKSLALLGYFTSEFVGTKVLNYDPVPGVYQGCVPLKEVGNGHASSL